MLLKCWTRIEYQEGLMEFVSGEKTLLADTSNYKTPLSVAILFIIIY